MNPKMPSGFLVIIMMMMSFAMAILVFARLYPFGRMGGGFAMVTRTVDRAMAVVLRAGSTVGVSTGISDDAH
ncbi:MAG: hypothetical protein ACYCXU_09585 [Thermoleophilia bacterium]